MWNARAEYADGTTFNKMFADNPYKNDNDQQYELEEWLITRHENCTWYSVNWIDD